MKAADALAATFCRQTPASQTRHAQSTARKAADSLRMVIAVGANEEDLSAKTGQAIQQATLKLQNLRETISKHGEMERDVRQQELLVVERERGREKRIEELDREIRVAGDMLQVCLDEREGVKVELEKARKDAEILVCDVPSDKINIATYCSGDWDDTVDDDESISF